MSEGTKEIGSSSHRGPDRPRSRTIRHGVEDDEEEQLFNQDSHRIQ